MKNWLAYIEVTFVAVAAALLLKMFVVEAIQVPTPSMEPTILPGDAILVNKLSCGIRHSNQTRAEFSLFRFLSLQTIQRCDVVVFKFPEEQSHEVTMFVKRCVGVAGDTILIQHGELLVNGKFIHAYANSSNAAKDFGPIVVSDDNIFVLGDNFAHSYDSRFWGFVPEENIIGKAELVYWSRNPSTEHTLSSIRWNRIGTFVR